jgi:small subunit ribosomal protein S29
MLKAVRFLHMTRVAHAPKAVAKGFKKGGDGKTQRKTTGSFRMFQDHIHAGQYAKKAPKLALPTLEQELQLNTVATYSELQKQRLSQVGAFKKDQFHELFASPITLVRDETKQIEFLVEKSQQSPSSENRVCFIGERGIGKSTLLAQAQALAVKNTNAVILPISYAVKLVDGSNDFWFDAKIGAYIQPMFLKKLLDKIEYANKTSLSKLNLSKEYIIEGLTKTRAAAKFSPDNTLLDLVKAKVDARQRGQVFQILINELLLQNTAPVFVTVDNFGSLMASSETAYRNVENKPIHSKELQITKALFSLTSGEQSFKKGAVILSTSSDDKQTITLQAGLGLAKPDAYLKKDEYNPDVAANIQGVKPIEVGRLSKENVSQLIQRYAEADVFRKDELEANTLEQLVNQKYVLSGNGNPLELVRSVAMHL